MMTQFMAKHWRNVTIIGLRFVFLLAVAGAIYAWRSQTGAADIDINDLAIGLGVGIGLVVILFVSALIPATSTFLPFELLIVDLIFTGGMLYLSLNREFTPSVSVDETEPAFFFLIVGFLLVTGVLWQDFLLGAFHAVGVMAIGLGILLYNFGADQLDTLIDPYMIPVIGTVIVGVGVLAWMYAYQEFGLSEAKQINKQSVQINKQLDDMRERARTIADMTQSLIGTLKFEKIVESTLNIGQLSLRTDNNRLVSMVLLFRASDETLYISDARGLRGTDITRTLRGKEGIIGKALEECIPIIGKNPGKDPELSLLGGLNNLRSMLVIPLRAHYDNYGILFFGSEENNAFNEDQIDTLHTISIQATMALQNAVLYNSLMEEKERLIQMEEDARKALVRDLHDIPTQTVSAVAMRIRIIMRLMEKSPDQVMGELQTVEEMTLRATEEIRHVLFKLRPLALESQGLSAALEQLAEKMQKTYKQPMAVKVSPDVEDYLDESQQGALFYLIEEAANNARKYAEAKLITAQVIKRGEFIAVRIQDNGKGFDMEAANRNERGSFGMINMRERAELLDGTLDVQSALGRGTIITVMIPIDTTRRNSNPASQRSQMPETKLAASARTMMSR